jgi:hypothetical protein
MPWEDLLVFEYGLGELRFDNRSSKDRLTRSEKLALLPGSVSKASPEMRIILDTVRNFK